ncbi:hypothetical protein CYMTET_6210 [Cymbomonas tetramitiformis]|uniref:Dihydrolipoamide acetyltransferase component of pyruvate dehydrogenase complex n=1 Tax=Cymbomonas tetramitiformis TaxID=36881 RepID=A0AAE0LIN1_9CHLO|nr:hypothetical protein CYMTET_6210 [Cymbomonas tetramitiformis]
MTTGKVVEWMKQEGDTVESGECILVVESDKADMDVETFPQGTLASIIAPAGSEAKVGECLAYLAETEEDIKIARALAAGLSASMSEQELDKPLPKQAHIETSTVPAPSGSSSSEVSTAAAVASDPAMKQSKSASSSSSSGMRIVATPYAKKRAKSLGVTLEDVVGSGISGRIVAEDVEYFAAQRSGGGATAEHVAHDPYPTQTPVSAAAQSYVHSLPRPSSAPPATIQSSSGSSLAPAAKSFSARGGISHVIPLTAMESAVAINMQRSLDVAVAVVAVDIEMTQFEKLYGRLKPKGVTITVMFANAVASALMKHPLLYATCDAETGGDIGDSAIIYNSHVNVAVAVSMPNEHGLITPVLEKAEETDMFELARKWRDLLKRARTKNLSPNEYASGNFTISNLGMYGVKSFQAILPPGQSAILALGSSNPIVTADDHGFIGVRNMMTVNLTFDHRFVYGTDAAEFLRTLRAIIENPELLTSS